MKKFILLLSLVGCVTMLSCTDQRHGEPKVLVFSKTAGFVHESIPEGNAAVIKLGIENGFEADTTKNAAYFTDDSLRKYSAVIFLNTTLNVLDYRQEAAFERYIQAGGGFVGVHSATDTEYDWKWYGRLVGAYFKSHPEIQEANFVIKDGQFPATDFFEDGIWRRTDELYNFKELNPDVNVILTVDEKTYKGGENGEHHPMSWFHEYDGGRAFYTALGHTKESYEEENFLKHLLAGIEYAIGDNRKLDYAKATTQMPPEEDRFTKVQLSMGEFFEPTEMTVLPHLDVLIIQRRGEILMYKNATGAIKQVGALDVYFSSDAPGVNAEEGMLGLAKDPHFTDNRWIYIYYSPIDKSVNRLSRFTFENDTILNSSETVILEVDSDRDICCHTGGSIAFGSDGLLYLSTGDNSTPFNEPNSKYVNNGFAPINDAPGHEQYDARRSSGNTNDLRGKIIRIKVNDDGSYDIPKGNLFPVGTEHTRPEIYTMGHRNPYRISVDQKNSYLYWGDVGPDARTDSLNTRGPKGYDEVGQARQAGNFGWPLFVGDNYAYHEYDYLTGKSGPVFDAENPVNNSRNNTGLQKLPPAKPAFIWYPYDVSPDFPQTATGGRNAMAGPVYYNDLYRSKYELPDYYNGKLIIYDWMRGWMKAVTMTQEGDFEKMEPFAPRIKLNSLIDMEAAHDGVIYLLEYGNGWFTKNEDSGLSYISYNGGNRLPVLGQLKTDKSSGVLPFKIRASVDAEDPEGRAMSYIWSPGNGETILTDNPVFEYTYNQVGGFNLSVEVKDADGGGAKSNWVSIYAGNEEPKVSIELIDNNKSFFLPGEAVKYRVTANDELPIDPGNFFVEVDYIEGFDRASSQMGHQQGELGIKGRTLMESMDCISCHKINGSSVGPSYTDVSKKYAGDDNAITYLSQKIRNGGGGVWGEVMMPAHITLSDNDAQQIADWILTLAKPKNLKPSLPTEGIIRPPKGENGTMILSASYTDPGGVNIKPLTGSASVALPPSTISFTGNEELEGFNFISFGEMNLMIYPQESGWIGLQDIDLKNVKSMDIMSMWRVSPDAAFHYEIRLDAPDGRIIGRGSMPKPAANLPGGTASIPLSGVDDGMLHNLYIVSKTGNHREPIQAALSGVKFY